MTGKASSSVLILLAVIFVLLFAAFVATLVLIGRKIKKWRKDKKSILKLTRLSPQQKKSFRKKSGHADAIQKISSQSPEETAKLLKKWLTDK
ncbi:MAG: hypothetical protein ACE5FU_14105 [Nitrospinota bacterium]